MCGVNGYYFGEVILSQRRNGSNSLLVSDIMFNYDDWSSLSLYLSFPSTSLKLFRHVIERFEKAVQEEKGERERGEREISGDRLGFLVFSSFGSEKGLSLLSEYPVLLSCASPLLFRFILRLGEQRSKQDALMLKILEKVFIFLSFSFSFFFFFFFFSFPF